MTRLEAAKVARRTLVAGIAGLPLAAILADPRLTAMAAETTEMVSIKTPSGRDVKAALAVPAATPAPTVLLIHEWWGLNDEIKTMAAEFAKEGFLALAVDLYDGKVAAAPADAEAYMNGVDSAQAEETLASWIAWLRADSRGNGKVGHHRLVLRRRLVAQRLHHHARRCDGYLLRPRRALRPTI